jgi:Sulfotransferase family/Tetratricopeptide repeat
MATAHHFLGWIFDNAGQEAKAMAAYQAAVALKPDLVAAQLRLGELYQSRRLRAESTAAFRAAATAAKGTAWGRLGEARALEASGAFDEALAATRAVVEAYPENAEGHAFLGKLLGQAGLTTEAAAHYERAAEILPEMGAAWAGIALNRKFGVDDGPIVARMNAAMARPQLTPRDRKALLFSLGKAHDDMSNYEEAMRNFEAANRLRAPHGGLRRDMLVRRFDQLIAATPPGYRDRQPDRGVKDATPILIVGMPRSGTTLTEQILSSHPEVAAGGELEFWTTHDPSRKDIWSVVATAEATRGIADDYLATLRALGPGAKKVTDKAPGNFVRLGLIHRIFPNATLIHCQRHPIDTALSIFTTNLETPFDFTAERSDLVFYYRQYQRLMAHWREVLPPDRFVEVEYEALVADPEPQARRLIGACGLEWNDACLAPHLNTRAINTASLWQARQPIYRTSVERWRRYEPWLGELRELAP